MPGIETNGASVNSPEAVLERPLFKPCKSLPRRAELSSDPDLAHSASSINGGHTSVAVPIATAPALPLTPPSAGHEEASSNDASGMQKTASSNSVNYIHGAMTPTKPSHPPTPETTPPRTTPSTYRPSLSQFGHASVSSRTESFQTAREMISDGETVTPRRSTQSLPHQKRCKPHKQQSSQNESPHGSSDASFGDDTFTPVQSNETLRPTRIEMYDGCDEERAPSCDRRPRIKTKKSHDRSALDGNDEDLPPIRGRKLRDRVKDGQNSMASPSLEQFREEIGWPAAEGEFRRSSGVSTSSTIEAMIIDAPRPANRTLRHTEKRQSLRSASSPQTKSERTSLVSNPDFQHRLVHKAARITEQVRKSIASEISVPASSARGGPPRNIEVVPVVVIPERRSSLHSSQSVSRDPSKAGSRRSSQRTASARKSRPPSLDLSRQRKRSFSDSIAAAPASDPRGRNIGRPVIPPRSSSLSAPTSRDSSRRASCTCESVQNEDILKDRLMDKAPIEQLESKCDNHTLSAGHRDGTDVLKTQSIWIGVDDMTRLRPPSLPFTPASIASSSPGLIEIKEARTVTFFPHNNESLLLVDQPVRSALEPQAPQPDDRQPQRDPRTPETLLPQDWSLVDSPLRNPRPPPKPPIHNVIPPTPEDEADRQLRATDDGTDLNGKHPRRFGSLRRGWVVRPRSDSFDRFARSLSVTSAKNRKAGRDIDSRLHPFWRPRRFWDDSPDLEEPQRAADMESDQIISNSLGMPQPRIVFDGPSLSRRSPHPRRSGALVGSTRFSPEALRSQTSLHQRRMLSLSWWRLRRRLGPVRNLRRRLRRSLQQREEAKREARRGKLKQKIGEAVLVGSSMQARDLRQPLRHHT